MYFFNINGLIRDLRAGTFSQRELYKYLAGIGLIASITILGLWLIQWISNSELQAKLGPNAQPLALPLYWSILSVLAMLAAFSGVFYYYNYVRGNGKDSLKRFVSVYWVVCFIRIMSSFIIMPAWQFAFHFVLRGDLALLQTLARPIYALPIQFLGGLPFLILFAWAMHKITAKN